MSFYSITEHSTITYQGCDSKADIIISKDCYKWLIELSKSEENSFAAIRLIKENVLKVTNYVGVLQSPNGTTIEILPKTIDNELTEQQKKQLRQKLVELVCISQRSPLQSHRANLEIIKNYPVHEWLMGEFLHLLEQMVSRGLRYDYERIEEESRYIRGRLRIDKQLQQGAARQHLFQISHEIFSPNRSENRLLKTAVDIVFKHTKAHWKLANKLKHLMDEIPTSIHPDKDFLSWQNNRLMKAYESIKPFCWLIIKQLNPTTQSGQLAGMSLLFPMEKLFEDYVGHCLQNIFAKDGLDLTRQSTQQYLCRHQEKPSFMLKPDFILADKFVLDAKWKQLDLSEAGDKQGTSKYNISQDDFYQMFAYGHKYLQGKGKLFLIYPCHEKFDINDSKHPLTFDFTPTKPNNDEKLMLYIVPCDWQRPVQSVFPDWFKQAILQSLPTTPEGGG